MEDEKDWKDRKDPNGLVLWDTAYDELEDFLAASIEYMGLRWKASVHNAVVDFLENWHRDLPEERFPAVAVDAYARERVEAGKWYDPLNVNWDRLAEPDKARINQIKKGEL